MKNYKSLLTFIMILVIAVMAFAIIPASADGTTVQAVAQVNGTEFNSLQEAFNAANDGDTVVLRAENPSFKELEFKKDEINNLKVLGNAIYVLSKLS